METKYIKLAGVVVLLFTVSACVVAPQQPVGYRMTSAVLPTYVNGQYVGVQSSSYVPPAQTSVIVADTNQAPVYEQSPVYVQTPTPVYTYAPYYAPVYVDPWYGVGLGLGIGIGFNYFGRCCWRGGWGGWRGGYRHR